MKGTLNKIYIYSGAVIILVMFLAGSGIFTDDKDADQGQSNQEIGRVLGYAADSMTRMSEGNSINSLKSHVRLIDELGFMSILEARAGTKNEEDYQALSLMFSNLRKSLEEIETDGLTAEQAAHLNQTGRLLSLIADKIYADHYDIEAEVDQMNRDF
ncbi:hypothetical protein K8O68_06335 [Salipaludibacillus sp. CUR1]|uniref:hypothetical protein n=1 Tax=Salipaludibacillus sp. CUR1 TaxID=2820003 RepID=UPI001E423234|nr:hypothetical protein [Salipaludibacillus sp. CUR1]MCE7792039.1 hypothetical protein [Salipaludibacillus sp. CUR1]